MGVILRTTTIEDWPGAKEVLEDKFILQAAEDVGEIQINDKEIPKNCKEIIIKPNDSETLTYSKITGNTKLTVVIDARKGNIVSSLERPIKEIKDFEIIYDGECQNSIEINADELIIYGKNTIKDENGNLIYLKIKWDSSSFKLNADQLKEYIKFFGVVVITKYYDERRPIPNG